MSWVCRQRDDGMYMYYCVKRPAVCVERDVERVLSSQTLFTTAIYVDDMPEVRQLLASNVDVTIPNHTGYTALHIAACKNNTDACQMLIDARANVNASDKHGVTPLWTAAQFGNRSACEMLLAAGADYDSTMEMLAFDSGRELLQSLRK
jgi:ankyrin repeat protein